MQTRQKQFVASFSSRKAQKNTKGVLFRERLQRVKKRFIILTRWETDQKRAQISLIAPEAGCDTARGASGGKQKNSNRNPHHDADFYLIKRTRRKSRPPFSLQSLILAHTLGFTYFSAVGAFFDSLKAFSFENAF